MKSLKVKLGAVLMVLFLTLSLVSCSPYAGVGTGYGSPYGYSGYGYQPYGGYYGYGYPSYRIAPRPYYAPRYNSRPYVGGGNRGSYSGGRGSYGGGSRGSFRGGGRGR